MTGGAELAATHQGSWWPDYDTWLATRSAQLKPAPKRFGGPNYDVLCNAPGAYVHDS